MRTDAPRHGLFLALALCACWLTPACVGEPQGPAPAGRGRSGPVRIGLSMDTLREERWQRDRDLFVARAQELGAEVLVQSANGDERVQAQQSEHLLAQGVDVLVVIPHNAESAAAIVEAARRQNVPVIAYDRLIRGSAPALYLSFDSEKVGEMQARYLLERAPRGNYVLVGGSQTDNNALLLREGQMRVLGPAVVRGDIKIVSDEWAREWRASEALRHTEAALARVRGDVAAVVASNDATAGGVVSALEARGLAGKVLVSGQDADLPGLRRIVAGTQAMTVYKPVHQLARRAAEAAVALARGEPVATTDAVHNGHVNVPSILLEPVVVDRHNIADTVIRDGYQRHDEIYRPE